MLRAQNTLNILVKKKQDPVGLLGWAREQQRRVGSTKPERVRDGRSYGHLLRGGQRHEIAFEQWVRLLKVDRRWSNSLKMVGNALNTDHGAISQYWNNYSSLMMGNIHGGWLARRRLPPLNQLPLADDRWLPVEIVVSFS
jgi:hypothetical protein